MKMHKFYGYERKLMVVDFFQMDKSSVPLVDFCLRRIIILLKKGSTCTLVQNHT